MNKKLIILIITTIVAVAVAYYFILNKQDEDNTILKLYGNIDIREVQLAFNGSEHIEEILVEEGESVKKGQLLAVLHNKILQAQLAEVQAHMLSQQQVLAKLKAGSRIEEIDKVKAELNAVRAKSKAASSSYSRLLSLVKKKVVTDDQVDQAKALRDVAIAEVEAIKQALNLLEAGTRKEDIASAEAVLLAREAAVNLIQQRLVDSKLIAPADGIIRNRILEVGSMVFPQTPVMSLAFVNPIWVRTYLPETALGKVALGSRAKIYTDSYPDKSYDGWVGFISPTSEFTPKTIQTEELRTRLVYSMRVFACNPNNELRLGMPATVVVDTTKSTSETPLTPEELCKN